MTLPIEDHMRRNYWVNKFVDSIHKTNERFYYHGYRVYARNEAKLFEIVNKSELVTQEFEVEWYALNLKKGDKVVSLETMEILTIE